MQPSGSGRCSAALVPPLFEFRILVLRIRRQVVVERIEVPSNRVDLGRKCVAQQLVGTKNLGQLLSQAIELMRTTKSPVLKVVDYIRHVFQDAEDVAAWQSVNGDAVPITEEFPPSLTQVLERVGYVPLGRIPPDSLRKEHRNVSK